MTMQAKERPVLNGMILDITGDLTYANREQFKTAVESVRQKGCRHLILNMADVRFVDSSGLGLLALVELGEGVLRDRDERRHVSEWAGGCGTTAGARTAADGHSFAGELVGSNDVEGDEGDHEDGECHGRLDEGGAAGLAPHDGPGSTFWVQLPLAR